MVSGDVNVSDSGLISFYEVYDQRDAFKNTLMFPAHNGEVVITSKIGEENYTDTASLSFGSGKEYMLQGATTFENINISGCAENMYANFYNLTLGDGIASNLEYYPAKTVCLGYRRQKGSYNESNDSVFVMNTGKIQTYYAGTFWWDSGYSKMSTIINGGNIGTVYGTGISSSYEQSKADITINGGTIGTCYGVSNKTKVGSGGVTITLNKDAKVTTISAVEPASTSSAATLNGTATLNLVGYDANTQLPTTISDFDCLELTNSSITVGDTLASMWNKVKRVSMTDNSLLNLNMVLTTPIEVVAKKSGNTWNTESALITAPATTENVFTLLTPVGYEFAYASDTVATWTLKKGEIKIGEVTSESAQALNIDMKLPDGVTYTPLAENASAYDFYQTRLNDLTTSGAGKEVPVIEPVEIKAQVKIYVDPINGDDNNKGSMETPYKTIQKALKSVEMLQTSDEPCAGIVVYLRGGNYVTGETITLGKEHSGKNGIPVIISAYNDEEVVISGGTSIAGSDFDTAKDLSATAYEKLPVAVRDRIVAVDLTKYGISKNDFSITSDGPNYQVFVDGEELTLSRYPNVKNLALTGKVLHIGYVSASYSDWPAGTNKDDPDIRFEMTDLRPTLWENDGHIWLNGSVYAEWEISNIRVKEANISTGVMRLDGGSKLGAKSNPNNTYYYYNILEELDVPGEYYVDKATGIMYMYPIGDMDDATVTFSVMAENLISLSEAENVVFNGLTIENGAGYGIYMTDCEQVVVQNCTLRNLGNGIRIQGKKSGIIYSDIYNIASRPAHISNAEKFMDYVPEQNFVQNCYIHNAGTRSAKICNVFVQGTGNVVSHNLLQGMYGVAIYFTNAKDCIVEYNEITGAPSGIYDYGAIYNPYHPSNTGNHIRYNYIHDIGLFSETNNPQAIYLDEGLSGNFVYGNIMSNVPRGFFTNSGSNNVIVNNIVQDGREGSTYSIHGSDNFKDYTIEERFARSNPLKSMYEKYIGMSAENQAELKKRDPLQAGLYETIKKALADGSNGVGIFAAHGNYAHDNLIFDHGTVGFLGTSYDIGDNIIATTNPFVNVDEHNFALIDDTIIAWEDKLPSMDRIGVVTNNKQAISSFSMYAPYNGEQKADPFAVFLKWTCSGGADGYIVEISKNEDMSEAKTYDVTNRYCFFDHDEYFTYNQTYYWRVTAYTVAESRQTTLVKANNGQVYSFKTMTMDDYLALNPLDTKALEETIGLAEDLAGQVKEISEGGLYYDGTVETLREAISVAKEVMSSLIEQDQVSVNKADAALQDAVNVAKASKAIQYVTFEKIDADEWKDKANSRVTTTDDGDELQMSIPSGGRAETVYEVGINTREILCFQYKLGTKSGWNGFAMAQTIPNTFITEGTDGYFICINPGQVELQKYQGGKKVIQIDKLIDDTIFDGGEYYDVEIGTINHADGSVAIHFKINNKELFDMTEYVDTVDDEIIPGSPIAGYETFGVVVNPANGITHMMKADLTAKKTADYSALDAEIAKAPEDGEAYTAETWEAYQDILESAESMTRILTVHDQLVVDEYVDALKEAREALVKKPAVEILTDGTDTSYTKGSNEEVSIHSSGELNEFVRVEMDGVEVASTNYTLKEGSTILTFKTEYLETLSVAEHKVTLIFNGGRSAEAKLMITENQQQGGGSGESPAPSQSPTPSESPAPSASPTPSESPAPGASPTPSESPAPSATPEADNADEDSNDDDGNNGQTVSEDLTNASNIENVPTGDNNMIGLYVVLAIISCGMACVLIITKKKRFVITNK